MWIASVWMYLLFAFNPGMYEQFQSAGAPCYVAEPGTSPSTPQPGCWSNSDRGTPSTVNHGMRGRGVWH